METCQFPPELTDDELDALLDGEGDDRSRDHIRRCAYCARRLAQAKQIEDGLRMKLYRKDCPTSLQLAEYQMNMLESAEDKARIEAHLKTCVRCQHDLQEWQQFIHEEEAAAASPTEVPDNIIPMPLQAPNRIVLLSEVTHEPKSAVRGDARVKRIIAAAGSTTIRLAFEPLADDRLKLTIQLSSPDVNWREGMVSIRQQDETVAVCHINEYSTGSCEVGGSLPLSLRFIAPDETLIEFNDVTP